MLFLLFRHFNCNAVGQILSKRSFFSRSANPKLLELRVQNYHSGKHQKCEIYLKNLILQL